MRAEAKKPAGGPTQDEILAISLRKLGILPGDSILDLGCGTGKVAIAAAGIADRVIALDSRPESIRYSKNQAAEAGRRNIEFHKQEISGFLTKDHRIFDCAFVGGSRGIAKFLPALVPRVRRTIVVNAVLLSTLETTVALMKDLGVFREAVLIQVSRSRELSGSIMFRPIDPVYIIVGAGTAC